MEMMVVSVATADAEYQVTGDGYSPEGEIRKDEKPAGKEPVLALMGRVSMLCNDAEFIQQEGKWKVEGDPTEGALYPFASKLGLDRQTEQSASPRIDTIPFESEHKFMATLHKSVAGGEILLVKGAPATDRRRKGDAARSQALYEGLRQACRPRRARAGAGVAGESGRARRQPRSGRPAQDSRPARSDRPA
jgi:magnesium-transporting ATPase (P-type)